MERITRTLELVEIETPNGEKRCIAHRDIKAVEGCKVLGRNAYIKEAK